MAWASVEINNAADAVLYIAFWDKLMRFEQELAQLVVHDSEGATKFVAFL